MQILQLLNRIQTIARTRAARRRDDEMAAMNDRSYEDSLFDLQVRSVLGAEYGNKEPSRDVYARLAHAVHLYNQSQRQPKSASAGFAGAFSHIGTQLGEGMAAFYRIGSRADSGRLVSGMLVAVLLVLAMTPNIMQVLNGGGALSSTARLTGTPGDIRVIAPGAQPEESLPSTRLNDKQSELLAQKMNEYLDAPVQQEESNELHPVELGMAPKNHDQLETELEHPRFPRIQQ